MTATDLLIWGIVAHLIADWFLQTHEMARRKSNLRDLLAWSHGCWHFLVQVPVFGLLPAILIAALHMLIDTRHPIRIWRILMEQTKEGDVVMHMNFWQDQALHILVIALVARMVVA